LIPVILKAYKLPEKITIPVIKAYPATTIKDWGSSSIINKKATINNAKE
jgi:hypothetical protein